MFILVWIKFHTSELGVELLDPQGFIYGVPHAQVVLKQA